MSKQIPLAFYQKAVNKMFHHHQYSAINRGIDWSLTFTEYLRRFSLTCAETGVEMTLTPNRANTLSIDRINNSKGYIKGNVRFVCWCINRGKGNLPNNQFKKIIHNG